MLTIQCDEHPDYDGTTAPAYECAACRCLRALQLDCAPADVAGHLQYALALGVLRVADQPAPTETGPVCDVCGQPGATPMAGGPRCAEHFPEDPVFYTAPQGAPPERLPGTPDREYECHCHGCVSHLPTCPFWVECL